MVNRKTFPEFLVCLNEESGMEVQECADAAALREAIQSHRYCAPEDVTTIEAWLATAPKPGEWCTYFKGVVMRMRSARDAREDAELCKAAQSWKDHINHGYDYLPRDPENRD